MRTSLLAALAASLVFCVAPMGCGGKPKETSEGSGGAGDASAGEDIPVAEIVPKLIAALKSTDERKPVLAAEALGKLGAEAKGAVPDLKTAMDAKNPLLKVAAAQAILRIDAEDDATSRAAVDAIASVLHSEDDSAQLEAARALGNLGPRAEPVIDELCEALKDDQAHVSMHAAEALARIGKGSAGGLAKMLPDAKCRHFALMVLSEIGPDGSDAAPAVAELLVSDDPLTRREATLVLAEYGPGAASHVEAIAKGLEDSDSTVKASSAYALGRIGEAAKGKAKDLLKALDGDDPLVAILAAGAFVELRPYLRDYTPEETAKLVKVLTEGLTNQHPRVRLAAADSLGKLGPEAKSAADALEQLTKDKDPSISKAAADALAKVKG